MNEIHVPYHLRVHAPPLAVCDVCLRWTWSLEGIDGPCALEQPDGFRCPGTLVSRVMPAPILEGVTDGR
ncbi:MAG: hypothetical protein EHM88_03350 [Candidatus Rokuibacteriota bacterium]|nr:MAG: hypothetical protein EHM88_03350 [Candidatus Rokubacteria bacterium]